MDVGTANFRFELDDPEKKPVTTRQPKTSELHLDSLDRYDPIGTNVVATGNASLESPAFNRGSGYFYANDNLSATDNCLINSPRNLLYGYVSRIALTQFNLSFRVPTVVAGYNDQLNVLSGAVGTLTPTSNIVTLPPGYYTVATFCSMFQNILRTIPGLGSLTIQAPSTYLQTQSAGGSVVASGMQITANNGQCVGFSFWYSNGVLLNPSQQLVMTRALRLIGANRLSFGIASGQNPPYPIYPNTGIANCPNLLASFFMGTPNFCPTDYVDIVSRALSNYKDTKDSNSAASSPGCVIGRIYISEYPMSSITGVAGWPQDSLRGLGPMTFCKTWTSPNWSQWSPNSALNNIDITLCDMFGQPLPWSSTFNTEWSATLTVTE